MKKIFSLLTAAALMLALVGCSKTQQSFGTDDAVWKDDSICASPSAAQYNDDGTFTLTVAVTNKTKFTKILTGIDVVSVSDSKERAIVQNGSFELEEKKYLSPDSIEYVQCDFEADEVLIKTSLRELTSQITVNYFGCVKNGEQPAVSDKDEFTVSITDAEITDTGGLEGKITVRNNYKTDKVPAEISFDIVTDGGVKVTTQKIVKAYDKAIKSGETITLDFAALAQNINSDISASKAFDSLKVSDVKIIAK